jgi:hypothetical protein
MPESSMPMPWGISEEPAEPVFMVVVPAVKHFVDRVG